jgi:hypothetical protein
VFCGRYDTPLCGAVNAHMRETGWSFSTIDRLLFRPALDRGGVLGQPLEADEQAQQGMVNAHGFH